GEAVGGTCPVDPRVTPAADPRTPPSTVRHPIIARLYVKQTDETDELGMAKRRQQILSGLSGRVLEIGAGSEAGFKVTSRYSILRDIFGTHRLQSRERENRRLAGCFQWAVQESNLQPWA